MNDVNPRRRYHSERREQQAQATRDAIVAAARKLFVRDGYAKTPVRAVAEEAGVSDQTIYAVFGTKGALLTAIYDSLDFGGGANELLEQLQAATGNPGRQIDLIVAFDLRLFERAADVLEAARIAASSDPEFAGFLLEGKARARRGREMVMDGWVEAGFLRPELSLDEAIDIFIMLCAPDSYNFMIKEAGWDLNQYQTWLGQTLRELLLSDKARQISQQPSG